MASIVQSMNRFLVVAVMLFASLAHAQTETDELLDEAVGTETTDAPLTEAERAFSIIDSPKGQNGIPLFGKRFRIDYLIDEINLLFFREKGSPSVVLIRPDGSKIYVTTFPKELMEWADEVTFDLIKIKDPMPGPWQVVGRLAPNSEIMVVTELQLHVDPLPEYLVSGESIKMSARVTNGGKEIEQGIFQDVVNLDVTFRSTNKEEFSNFGMKAKLVASFRDDGTDLDERPLDGIFTGKFMIDVAPGEWEPEYTIATPMFERQLLKDPIIVHDSPIQFSYDLTDIEGDYHTINVAVAENSIEPKTVLYNGELIYPDGEIHQISINQPEKDVKTIDAVNYSYGLFRVKLTAFGQNRNGRDVVIDVPEFTFSVEEPEIEIDCTPIVKIDTSLPEGEQTVFVVPPECQNLPSDSSTGGSEDIFEGDATAPGDIADGAELGPTELPQSIEKDSDNTMLIVIIVVGNLLLIIGGILVLKFVVFRKPKLDVTFDDENNNSNGDKAQQTKGGKKSKAVENSAKSDAKNDGSDDLIDLNLDD